MKIIQMAVAVKLNDGKVYEVALSEDQKIKILYFISTLDEDNEIKIQPNPVKGLDLVIQEPAKKG